MGGMICQHVALEHPERIQTLVLGCTRLEGGFFNTLPKFSGIIAMMKFLKAKTEEEKEEKSNGFLFPKKFLDARTSEGITNREAIREVRKKRNEGVPVTTKEGTNAQMAVVREHALTKKEMKQLKNSKIPILAITGDEDVLIPPTHSYKMVEQIGAKLVVIEGAGHALADQAGDEFNVHLRTFMDDHPRPSPTWAPKGLKIQDEGDLGEITEITVL
eukprot:TRINITY_DN2096_c0_g1_i1.p1 TRINITY_DN2096_c0_g1~~TRINITY_DN2096_c0_g1_i1.p1  ORF type:complete len:216 (-),score=48.34 TRINITY_DN2096_c0_g1_i1:146-793(-)